MRNEFRREPLKFCCKMMYRYLSNENTQIVYSSKMVLMRAAMGQFSL